MDYGHLKAAAAENARLIGLLLSTLAALSAIGGLVYVIFGSTTVGFVVFAAVVLLSSFSVATWISYRERVRTEKERRLLNEERERRREERSEGGRESG